MSFNMKMRHQQVSFSREDNVVFLRGFMVLLLSYSLIIGINFCDSRVPSSLKALSLEGHLMFHEVSHAAKDFGNRYTYQPLAVLHPKSVYDIAATIKHVWQMGPSSQLTVAARGHGHSLQGQSQALGGIVINMESLKDRQIHVSTGNSPYVDASGGDLWIDILHESLKYGLAPRSWTDYLHLTVGGTLEGFVIINKTGLLNNWRSSFSPQDPLQANQFNSDGKTLFCLELAKYFNTFLFLAGSQ